MDLTELYQDLILDHGKKPRNFGKCNKFNHDAEGHNPLCGDNIHVYLSLDVYNLLLGKFLFSVAKR